ncbi:MAG: DsbA family protein [Alphaproteobacteria bacterium]|nr:DsbA family protein [Alphaproteobacteria bacterium]
MILIYSYTIYHSPNAYLGSVLARRLLATSPEIRLLRRPFFVPRDRGVRIADLVGGKETPAMASYHREDCPRWAARYRIPFNYPAPEIFTARAAEWARSEWHREELPARAYYAARSLGQGDALDDALFDAAWVEGLDVNAPDTIRWAAARAGLDGEKLLAAAQGERPGVEARAALAEFDRLQCPGVPTFVMEGQRFFGKDRVEWLADEIAEPPGRASPDFSHGTVLRR